MEGLPEKGTREFSGVVDMLSLDGYVGYTSVYLYQIDLTICLKIKISLNVKYISFLKT